MKQLAVLNDQSREMSWHRKVALGNYGTDVLVDDTPGVDIEDMPNLKAWMKRIEHRPAVQKGLDIPEENMKKQIARDPKKQEEMIEAAKKMMISVK